MSDATELPAFDIAAPLPAPGVTTLLEASAGTGKTWTIGALVARFVAEGRARLDDMLIITFGRAASQELRERVRAQLVELEEALRLSEAAPGQSELIALLLDGDDAERRLRHRRVVEALAGFDAATIATTHQFCSLVLASLGVAGDTDPRARLVDDLDDLTVEVVDDLYLRAFAKADTDPVFTHAEALAIARAAVGDPQAELEPSGSDRGTAAGRRVGFARAVRAELDARKRRLGLLSYDDLLQQLADVLEPPDSPARTRMRERWSVVMVDEFQDTDPVQWQVLDRAFTGIATMVLIGDPKQAIYAFRGGDVVTYLEASESAVVKQTLGVNRRSDAGLVAAFGALLDGAELGDPRIVVRPVTAYHAHDRLEGAPHPEPFRVRTVPRAAFGRSARSLLTVGDVRPFIARDLALDVAGLLASGASFDGVPLQPHHVAVIAHTHRDLAAAQRALHEVGVPAVIAGGGSVFATPAAVEWLTLLEGLEQPHRSPRVRAAGLTCFVGHSAVELDAGGDRLTDDIAETLRSWADVLARRGVAAVLEAASVEGLPARLLAQIGGERRLTDIRHVGEVLHEMVTREHLGLVALLGRLRAQIREGRAGGGSERTRRLDSDARAVQLVTIHASKGLEYPVVYLPGLADRYVSEPQRPLFHSSSGRRSLDVGGNAAGAVGWREHCDRCAHEEAGESLRLLYVGLTRACSQVVCWWAPMRNAESSSLHRLLMRAADATAVAPSERVPPDDALAQLADSWRARGGPSFEVAQHAAPSPAPPAPDDEPLAVRRFAGSIDAEWRRTSYSSLTHVEHEGGQTATATSEPEFSARDDEADPDVVPAVGETMAAAVPLGDVVSPMADLPVGATFGSLVHAVLEHTDPDADDLRAEIAGHLDEQLSWWPVDLDRELFVDAILAVCATPLGPIADDRTLAQIPLRDRLRELDFELPLAGGDLARAGARRVPMLGDLAPALRRHLPEGDPVRGFADALDRPALGQQSLHGYLTGSVDVVLRLGDPEAPRYVVVDYKTNWLGAREVPLTAAAYRPEALDAAMEHSDYPLQALLYAVVLHRFLRWRQPGYDPATHLGGVAYLYLRGLCGPDTPVVDGQTCGVFTWRPPVELILEVSDLLDGGEAA